MRTALWVCLGLHLCLAAAYGLMARGRGQPVRRVLARLALCAGLTLLATYCVRLLLAQVSGRIWTHAPYLPWVVPVVLGIVCQGVFLAPEAKALLRWRREAGPGLVVPLALLGLVAVVLVSIADLGLEWLGWTTDAPWKEIPLPWNAWAMNVVIVFCGLVAAFALTSRLWAALLLVVPAYLALALATLEKLRYMHSAVQPLDVLSLPEFVPLFQSFFGIAATIVTATAVVAWCGALLVVCRGPRTPMPRTHRVWLGIAAVGPLLALAFAFTVAETRPPIAAALIRLGAPDGAWKEQAKRNGFLLSFLSELPSAFVSAPPGYSPPPVRAAAARYQQFGERPPGSPRPRVNLIVYLVESFMDPDDLGVPFTQDPIPNVRRLRHSHIGGYALVPREFGGSASTEFELLTGMSMAFLPEGSLAYRQYLRRPIPSLPGLLGCLGYATTAVQPDSRFYYDRERAYGLLGFDQVEWLDEVPGIERDPRVGWPTDRTVVDAVLRASRGPRPFFVFAFPSSTHSYYRSGVYRGSSLDVADPIPTDSAGEVKEYINALRVADREIGSLIEHFRHRPDSTLIVVLGDHLPPLSAGALHPFYRQLSSAGEIERRERLHRVPLLVWANYELPREAPVLSVNNLPSFVLEKMGIPTAGFLALTDSLRRRAPVLTSDHAGGGMGERWAYDSMPRPVKTTVDDYRLLEYDLLLGEQYSLSSHVMVRPPRPGRGTASRPRC